MELKIGVVQMDCMLKDKEANMQKAEEYLDQTGANVDVLCLPELFTTGYHLDLIKEDFYTLAETVPGPTVNRLAEKAKKYNTAIIANIVEKDSLQEAVLYDTTFVIDEEGRYLGKYRKVHLYPTEHQYFRSGSEFPVFEIRGVKIGIATCYDHAFEEMFRIMALKGAEVIFIPSAVPKNYEYLLNLRTRARAQDNQIFTVAINRIGTEDKVTYCGLSKIVNPRGEVVCEAGDEEGILIGTIDLSLILKERKQEPILRSRRPELYGSLAENLESQN
ncbi:carbon-nitrogen hydrolase family protein [Paenibacillus mendelii]|uniref:Carbon-nitrogen hydrolase family protein n=1 Tax=Paenibacillus mendelii TaxID=206163 RepID=A0ABV6J7Y9_9BACL|nr:carbon-nitrogen hydrolase family protein [Paenibacillus mendelii]MCQ6561355.1 carbon-nitrogen hydrolase family protein [Paenibacillus mendelii]